MTTSTWGRSSPRAATSVASNSDGVEGVETAEEKAVNILVRALGDWWPWREKRLAPEGRAQRRAR